MPEGPAIPPSEVAELKSESAADLKLECPADLTLESAAELRRNPHLVRRPKPLNENFPLTNGPGIGKQATHFED